MTQASNNSYQQLQQQIVQLQQETERKFNRLLDESIATNDRIDRLAQVVERLVTEAAADRAQTAVDRNEFRSQLASDRVEFREEIQRIWQYLSHIPHPELSHGQNRLKRERINLRSRSELTYRIVDS